MKKVQTEKGGNEESRMEVEVFEMNLKVGF
jgi:hypothetical protein